MMLIPWALFLAILVVAAALIMRGLVSLEHRRMQRMKSQVRQRQLEDQARRTPWEHGTEGDNGGRAA